MLYGFSVLFIVLALTTGLPAVRQLMQMRKIKPNSSTTTGEVQLTDHSQSGARMTGVMTSMLGKVGYSQISYQTPNNKERILEIIENINFGIRRYKSGDLVKVVYDKNAPWLAYPQKEWDRALRDLWMAGGELLLAVVLWAIGLALKLPLNY